jgi:cytochrome oxidase Cu insertion factor (SCO1/SenC/PrrC family)
VLGTVPSFSLTERHGATVTADDLAGHVWVADFVFTRCPDICPVLSTRMAALQDKVTGGADSAVRLVSISVDPVHDTPDVLATYADHYRAGPSWLFLTGSRDAVAALLRDGFRVAFSDAGPATSPITHSDRFVLVDRQLRIRGYYHGNDPADLSRLVADTARLRDDPAA